MVLRCVLVPIAGASRLFPPQFHPRYAYFSFHFFLLLDTPLQMYITV